MKIHCLITRLESAFWVALMATLPDVDHFLSAGRLDLQVRDVDEQFFSVPHYQLLQFSWYIFVLRRCYR